MRDILGMLEEFDGRARRRAIVLGVLAAVGSFMATPAVAGSEQVHWTITGQSSVTFDWAGTDSTIQFGTMGPYSRTVTAVHPIPSPYSSPGPFWEAKLTGLLENTRYNYAIGNGVNHTFRTPPARGSSGFTIYVQGDIGAASDYPEVSVVQSMVTSTGPAFVLMVGDLTYGDQNGLASVDNHFNDVMVWSQDAAYMPAWGNHEGDTPTIDDMRNYKGRFDLPHASASPGAPSEGCCGEDWYWFDYGNVRFIAYPEPWTGALPDWHTKAASIMDEAQLDPAIRFIVTFGHRPAYSSGHHAGLSSLRGFLDALGSSHDKYVLNLNGHSHNYERTYPQRRVVHVTVGTGGSSLEEDGACLWATCQQPLWSAFRAFHLGPLKLRFTDSSIVGSFLCGPPGGGTNDLECAQGDAADSFVITGAVPDQAPVVSAPAPITVPAGSPVQLVITAGDPNTEAISALSADLTGLPAGNNATFTAAPSKTSGTLTWTPTVADARPAPYAVTFTASNALSGSASAAVTVTAGQPPTAALTLQPSTGNSPLLVTANATGTTDPDGNILSYEFDFGDGAAAGPQAGATASHTYAAGSYQVAVVVRDSGGFASSATATVLAGAVDPGPNLIANPSFETSTSGWGGASGGTLQRVSGGFDGGYALEITGPASGTAKFGINDTPDASGAVPSKGTIYRFAAWVRSLAGRGKAQIRVREYLGGVQQGAAAFSQDVTLSSSWQRVRMEYVASTAGSTIDFNVLYAPLTAGEVFQVDNVSEMRPYAVTGISEDGAPAPRFGAALARNPHAGSVLRVTTTRAGAVRVDVYDASGRRLRTALNEVLPAGRRDVRLDGGSSGRSLPSGVYFYQVEAAEAVARGKFVVLR